MNILDIAIAKKLAGGGGGSGTDNYNDLSNLPKINDTTLSGNKSSSALGLQSEINSDSKLASDLVDDTNQDNKFVTSTEKNTWNAKQNAIDSDHKLSSDLVDDANKTNKFVTSTEKQTWNAKQNAIDADHKLSSSLVSFTEAEDAALASGINSSKVGQISTNQTNILYVTDKTGKNLVNPELFKTGGYISNSNGTVQPSESLSYMDFLEVEPNTEYYITPNQSNNWGAWYDSNKTFISGLSNYGAKTAPANAKYLRCTLYDSTYATTFMVCKKTDYDISSAYQPYALPNYDLTRLQAEDRAALAEEIDAGAKNLWDFANASIPTNQNPYGATYTKNDSAVTVTSTNNWGRIALGTQSALKAGTYVFRCKISNYSKQNGTPRIYIQSAVPTGTVYSYESVTGNGIVEIPFTLPSDGVVYIAYYGNFSDVTGSTDSYTASENMICTKAAFGVSNKFVPYRPNYDLVCQRSGAITKRNVTGTDWTLTDVSLTGSSGFVYFLSAGVDASGNYPTGILISTSNNSSDFMNALKLVCKNDDTRTTRMFSCSAIDMPYQSTTYYVWSKSTVSATNAVTLMWHKEPR